MSTHQEQAEQLARGMCCQMWCARHSETLCTDCAVFASEIRAALDAAARTALEEAAKELPTVHLCASCDFDDDERFAREGEQKRNEVIRGWLRARAASLGEQKE